MVLITYTKCSVMSKKVQSLHLYTEAMPRSRVRDPPGAYAIGCDCQIIFLAIAQLVERSIVVVHSNKSRMVPGSIPGGEKPIRHRVRVV